MNKKSLGKYLLRFLVIAAVLSLFVFLFSDYFEASEDMVLYYSLCATFLTFYLWGNRIFTK